MARAFLSFSLLLRSMSSISLIFCKGTPGRLLSWQDTMVGACHLRGQPWCWLGLLPLTLLFPTFGLSYLGDFSQDDSSVLLALSQSLHGSQEFFPVLNFLHQFFKPVQLGSWLLLLHTGSCFTFLYVLPSGKDILESSFLLLQISCRAQRRSC